MRLTKQTSYGIRILIACAQADGALLKVAEIARRLDISPQNTFKTVHILAKAGFVAPVRGPSGGVRLARPADEIRISAVVQAVEFAGGDTSPRGDEPNAAQPFGTVIDAAFAAFLAVLDGHTLADLARASAPRRPIKPRTAPRKAARRVTRAAAAVPD
ncbi:MAG: RrF2 family transcriptional regulator [Hyphomicrobiaceae bacterium]